MNSRYVRTVPPIRSRYVSKSRQQHNRNIINEVNSHDATQTAGKGKSITHTENNEVTNDKITIKLEMENKIASIPYYYIGRDPFGK